MKVTLAWSFQARQAEEREIELPLNADVEQAQDAWLNLLPVDWVQDLRESNDGHWSIWGRRVALDQVLRPGDRLEWTRPLRVDPKVARRERFVNQGPGRAGLFAKKPGWSPSSDTE